MIRDDEDYRRRRDALLEEQEKELKIERYMKRNNVSYAEAEREVNKSLLWPLIVFVFKAAWWIVTRPFCFIKMLFVFLENKDKEFLEKCNKKNSG